MISQSKNTYARLLVVYRLTCKEMLAAVDAVLLQKLRETLETVQVPPSTEHAALLLLHWMGAGLAPVCSSLAPPGIRDGRSHELSLL